VAQVFQPAVSQISQSAGRRRANDHGLLQRLRIGKSAIQPTGKSALLRELFRGTPAESSTRDGARALFWGLLCQRCMVKKTPHRGGPGFGLALFFILNTFLPIMDLGAGDLLEYRHGKDWFRYLIALEKILGYILVPLWTMALTGLIK
jgi:hypothetical protein